MKGTLIRMEEILCGKKFYIYIYILEIKEACIVDMEFCHWPLHEHFLYTRRKEISTFELLLFCKFDIRIKYSM
jgi:hypothetical protein